jgi:hypothetical protein
VAERRVEQPGASLKAERGDKSTVTDRRHAVAPAEWKEPANIKNVHFPEIVE